MTWCYYLAIILKCSVDVIFPVMSVDCDDGSGVRAVVDVIMRGGGGDGSSMMWW